MLKIQLQKDNTRVQPTFSQRIYHSYKHFNRGLVFQDYVFSKRK